MAVKTSKTKTSNGRSKSAKRSAGTLPQEERNPVMGGRRMDFSDIREDAVAQAPIQNIEGLNREIVSMLQDDGRTPFSTIAKKLDVSEGTVRSRVNRMREANVIHFITVLNPLALGYSAWAMLGIKVAQGANVAEVSSYFRDLSEVVYLMRVASRFDLLAEIVCETPDDLRRFLDVHCHGQTNIASVEPMVGLGLHKSLFKWETPLLAGSVNHGAQPKG